MKFLKALFGPPDIERLEERQDVSGLIKAAKHRDAGIRARAVEALAKLGSAATTALLESACSESESERQSAVEVLDKLGWQPQNPNERVLFLIAQGEWSEVSTTVETGLQALVEGLRESKWDIGVQTLVAAALGFNRNPEAAEALSETVRRAGWSVVAHNSAFHGVAGGAPKISDDKLALGLISMIALSRFGNEAARRLLGMLESFSLYPDQLIDICHGLVMIGAPVVEPLSDILRTMPAPKDRDHRSIWQVMVMTLGGLGDPDVAPLLSNLDPRDSQSKETVEVALRTVQAPKELLIQNLGIRQAAPSAKGNAATLRLLAAATLVNRREEAAVPGLVHCLRDPANPVRLIASVGLGRIGGSAAHQALVEQLQQPEEATRAVAVMALEETRHAAAITALKPLLADDSPLLRGLAQLAIDSLSRETDR